MVLFQLYLHLSVQQKSQLSLKEHSSIKRKASYEYSLRLYHLQWLGTFGIFTEGIMTINGFTHSAIFLAFQNQPPEKKYYNEFPSHVFKIFLATPQKTNQSVIKEAVLM